jgi:hypothetical protein
MNDSLDFLFRQIFQEGDDPERIRQKVCQDIFISKLSSVDWLSNKVVFKGGIVMYELTKGKRGYTKDIDIDFIHFPISEDGANDFIEKINASPLFFSNISVKIQNTEELHHKNYHGRRVILDFIDEEGTVYPLSVDIGVHTDQVAMPLAHPYEIRVKGVSVHILFDANELSIVEKLTPFALQGTDNDRYRDLFDAYWRLKFAKHDIPSIVQIFDEKLLFTRNFTSRTPAVEVITKTLQDKAYQAELKKEINWTDETVENICSYITDFLNLELKEK